MLEDIAQVDQMPKSEGRDMSMLLSPDPDVIEVAVESEEEA